MVGLVGMMVMVMRRMIRSFESGFFCLFFRFSFLCVSDGDSGISDVIWWFTRRFGWRWPELGVRTGKRLSNRVI
jgi:hypothetical protein